MKKIMMVKYGFVRWPEEDFYDDGNRFTCYKAGKNVRVSKLIADGNAYLSASSQVGKGTLPYEVYSKLPHHSAAIWKYNGVSVASLTDQDLEDFMAACLAYELEYEAAEKAIAYPTMEELKDQCTLIQAKLVCELHELEKLMGDHGVEAAVKFSDYEWKTLKQYLVEIINKVAKYDPDKYPETIFGSVSSFSFVKPNNADLNPTYYYTWIKETFEKHLIV